MQSRSTMPRLVRLASSCCLLLAVAACGGPAPTASVARAPTVGPLASVAPSVAIGPTASPSATTAPSIVTTTFQLEGRRLEWCGSIGGCGAYAAILSDALPETEVRIEVGEAFGNVAGLPAQIPVGRAIIRFRTVLQSDDRTINGPVSEATNATCEGRIDARARVGVLVRLTIRAGSCAVETFSLVTIID